MRDATTKKNALKYRNEIFKLAVYRVSKRLIRPEKRLIQLPEQKYPTKTSRQMTSRGQKDC